LVRIGGNAVILLDVGANADSKPDWLAQFAIMGKVYAKSALGRNDPSVGILSNGEEEGKGNELIREATALIAKLPLRFVGNIEPKDLLNGTADVVVSDGFVGNIMLKSLEATSRVMNDLIRKEIMANPISTLGGILARGAFRRVRKQVDPFEVGGAPLLGVNGVVIIGHGRSNDVAIKNAINQARKAVSGRLIEQTATGLQELGETERR
jgi:glycerol-3-phosphate acyltransferase PlsX